jgi:hypothetical protein
MATNRGKNTGDATEERAAASSQAAIAAKRREAISLLTEAEEAAAFLNRLAAKGIKLPEAQLKEIADEAAASRNEAQTFIAANHVPLYQMDLRSTITRLKESKAAKSTLGFARRELVACYGRIYDHALAEFAKENLDGDLKTVIEAGTNQMGSMMGVRYGNGAPRPTASQLPPVFTVSPWHE